MKIFKNISVYLSGFLLMTAMSCQESLSEINENPNLPENVPTSGIMNSATKELMDATRNDFESGRMTLPWMQYSAQVQYTEEDRFQFRETSSLALYTNLFAVAKDYKNIIDINTDPVLAVKAAAYGNNQNQIAVSRIMLAYTFSILVDSFGPVPYYSYGNSDSDFQALNLQSFSNPIYASQEKIYTDILDELKKAANQLVISDNGFEGDKIYNGDMTKWKKFANSLRLRIANRVKNVIPSANAHIQDAIISGVMTSNDDNAALTYGTTNLEASPIYTAFYVNNRTDFKITNTMVDVLKGQRGGFTVVDPRLFKFAAPTFEVDTNDNYILNADGSKRKIVIDPNNPPFNYQPSLRLDNYRGLPYGLTRQMAPTQNSAGASNWSKNVIKSDFSEVLMEYSEVEFLLSEINGWSAVNYQNGVRASLERWGVSATDIALYVSTLAPASKTAVLNQKWIALFMQPQEAYAEWRRTGYPQFLIKPGDVNSLLVPTSTGATTYTFVPLSPVGTTLTEMPSRITYPVNMQQLNPTGYQSGVAKLGPGGDKVTTKLIWDTN